MRLVNWRISSLTDTISTVLRSRVFAILKLPCSPAETVSLTTSRKQEKRLTGGRQTKNHRRDCKVKVQGPQLSTYRRSRAGIGPRRSRVLGRRSSIVQHYP